MIYIGTKLFDLNGHFMFELDRTKSDIKTVSRRITRTPTLDGLSIITDNGYTASDRILSIVLNPNSSRVHQKRLKDMIKLHKEIIICTHEGVFTGSISEYSETDRFTIVYFIEKQLAYN